jgi:HKD family nuclease
MLDARQCAAALAEESTRPRLAGYAYTLMPVKAGGAFHPKIILLVGRRKGLLFLGSHNLTLSGLSHNRELTNRFEFASDKDNVDVAAIKTVWQFMRAWTAEQPEELREVFNTVEGFAKWLHEGNAKGVESPVCGALPEGASLWEMVHVRVPSNLRRITVIAPYFDRELAFLRKLNDEFAPKEFVVGIDTETVQINKEARKLLPQARFVEAAGLREEHGYLHAKAFLFETTDGREMLVTGSANASSPAWLAKVKERNAEIVVLRESSKRQSVAATLGLKELHTQPRLTEEAWSSIQSAHRTTSTTSTQHVPLVAVETERGFEVDTKLMKRELLTEVTLVGKSGEQLGIYHATSDEPYLLSVEVAELEIRCQTSLLLLQTSDGKSLFAIVHHTFDVPVSAQTDKQKLLRLALDSLGGDAPMFDEMFKLVERVVFDETNDYQGAPKSGTKTDKSPQQKPEAEQTIFAGSLKDRRGARLRERFASSGDLGLLLDALNRRLRVGLEGEVTTSAGIDRSEEEIVNSDDEVVAVYREADEIEIARICQRKTARMMRLMTGQLERAGKSGDMAFAAISQLAAVLGILLLLRELEWKRARFPGAEEYILYKDERRFFLDAIRLLYAQRSAVMEHARAAHGSDDMPAEVATVIGLLFWLAYDIGIDLRYEFDGEDRKEREMSVREMARLLAMAPHLYDDPLTAQKALDAIMRIGAYKQEKGATEAWYEAHVEWIKVCAELHREPQGFDTIRRMPEPGDLSYLTRSKDPKPFVVLDSDGTSVKVVDLDKEGEEKNYGIYNINYIAIVNVNNA